MGEDEFPKKDAGPDGQRPLGRDDDTEGHKRESGEDPLSARPRQPRAVPDTEDDTEGHKR